MEAAKSEIVAPEQQVRSFEDLLLLVSNGPMCFECLEEEREPVAESQSTDEKTEQNLV